MATDQSPPRIRIILTIAFSSLVILVALNYVFRSYFLMMTEDVAHQHLAKPEELEKLRAGEERNLTMSPVPIKRAMAELHTRGRDATDALKPLADITPQQSTDLGPMIGWLKNPNMAYLERASAEAEAAAAAAADGGAPAPAAAADAGAAPKKTPATPPAPPAPKH